MARGPVSRPLREIFIARVIAIKLVQQERVAVTEKHVADFFESGRVPGQIGTYLWPLHGAPEAVPSRAARVAARWGGVVCPSVAPRSAVRRIRRKAASPMR